MKRFIVPFDAAQGKLAHYERRKKPNSTKAELLKRCKCIRVFLRKFVDFKVNEKKSLGTCLLFKNMAEHIYYLYEFIAD